VRARLRGDGSRHAVYRNALAAGGRRPMMSNGASVDNQKKILANQRMILANQKRIEANQAKLDKLLTNQKKLDQILANQKAILSKLG
jgi:hypothetical protein